MTAIIGIDLGTTNSLCAVFQDGEPRLIPNVHGDVITPSVVGVDEAGRVLVGHAARELQVTQPQRCAATFKRLMGTNRKTAIGSHNFSAPELSSLVLKSLKHDAEEYLAAEVREAVITVPAYFNDKQRTDTKLAGRLAGLDVRRIINEPTAAAMTYGFHDRQAETKMVVIDLGGGTFDVTTMEVFEGTLEITSTCGESMLGGEDFTNRLLGWALAQRGLQFETAELKQPLLVSRLRQECEQAKCRLLVNEEVGIRFPDNHGEFNDAQSALVINRGEFATLVDTLVKRLARSMSKAVRDSRCEIAEFGSVILVGGATRMKPVRDYVRRFFGCGPLCTFNPDEVVALGAGVQAALIRDDRAVDDMVMTDVCPFTLGVEVVKEFGSQLMVGYYLPVIHRNTTIPVSREEPVATVSPNQQVVTVRIYQGESRKVKDNLFLGELRVRDIPPGPSGQQINIRFTYDINGILEVEAFLPETGRKFTTVLSDHAEGLSKRQISQAVRTMQAIKFYPRDELCNRHLVLFSERIVGEVGSFQRSEVEEAIDAFEQAMSAGDRDWFEAARTNLLMVLSTVGFPYDEEDQEEQDSQGTLGDAG